MYSKLINTHQKVEYMLIFICLHYIFFYWRWVTAVSSHLMSSSFIYQCFQWWWTCSRIWTRLARAKPSIQLKKMPCKWFRENAWPLLTYQFKRWWWIYEISTPLELGAMIFWKSNLTLLMLHQIVVGHPFPNFIF